MINLRCKCGHKFAVKSELAGKAIKAPCCQAAIRVPQPKTHLGSSQSPTSSDKVKLNCSCGRTLAIARPTKTVRVTCPGCEKKLTFDGSAKKRNANRLPDSRETAKKQDRPLPVAKPAREVLPVAKPARQPLPVARPAPRQARQPAPQPRPQQVDPLDPSQAVPMGQQNTPMFGGPPRQAPKRRRMRTPLPRFGIMGEVETFGSAMIVGVVALLLVGGIGTYLIVGGVINMTQAADADNWSEAPGKVITSDIDLRYSRKARSEVATVILSYEYTVEGVVHTGDKLSFEKNGSFSSEEAYEKLGPYPAGAECTVYYDPQNPSTCVLIRGVQYNNYLHLAFGVGFVLLGLVLGGDLILGALNVARGCGPPI